MQRPQRSAAKQKQIPEEQATNLPPPTEPQIDTPDVSNTSTEIEPDIPSEKEKPTRGGGRHAKHSYEDIAKFLNVAKRLSITDQPEEFIEELKMMHKFEYENNATGWLGAKNFLKYLRSSQGPLNKPFKPSPRILSKKFHFKTKEEKEQEEEDYRVKVAKEEEWYDKAKGILGQIKNKDLLYKSREGENQTEDQLAESLASSKEERRAPKRSATLAFFQAIKTDADSRRTLSLQINQVLEMITSNECRLQHYTDLLFVAVPKYEPLHYYCVDSLDQN